MILLQIVLGVDNLLYISLVSKQGPEHQQKMLRQVGIAIAIVFRIILLFLIVSLIDIFKDPVFSITFDGVLEGHFNIHSLIVLSGGGFIIYTAFKEIWHLVSHDNLGQAVEERKPKSPCIDICEFDGPQGWCLGCGRTLKECQKWKMMNSIQRKHIQNQSNNSQKRF